MDMERIRWYINRFRSMSKAEIGHRITETIKKNTSSFYTPDFSRAVSEIKILPRFPISNRNLKSLLSDTTLFSEWEKLASNAQRRQLRFLGITWPKSTKTHWSLDPVTNKQWPDSEYCFNISYRHVHNIGDVKYVWEINRLQYLQPIAALAASRADTSLSKFCAQEVESWIDDNPPYKGINWVSGIELSSRIVSMLIVITLLGEQAFTEAQTRKMNESLSAHGYWLYRYPSRFSSANNHLIAEAAGLFLLGKLAPWLPNSREWAEYGHFTLVEEATKQIYDDGVGAEQSPTYLAYSLEWLLLTAHVAGSIDKPFPKSFWERITAAGEYLRWLTDKSGNQPRIGDDDEGRVIYSQESTESYVSSILACISATTKRKDLAPPIPTPHLREAIFGRIAPNTSPLQGSRCFRIGGYTILRDFFNNKEIILVVDHGPLGYLSIAAHGHADALSIWLHVDGNPIIVDAGTYLYHSGKYWRDYMRGTLSHNTLSIGKMDSSCISGAFNWASKAQSTLKTFDHCDNKLVLKVEHDGYLNRFGVIHSRTIKYNEGKITISDCLTGDRSTLPVEIGFLFHPETDLIKHNQSYISLKEGRELLKIHYENELLQTSIHKGESDPICGWYSPKFGEKKPAPRLKFTGNLSTHVSYTIALAIQ